MKQQIIQNLIVIFYFILFWVDPSITQLCKSVFEFNSLDGLYNQFKDGNELQDSNSTLQYSVIY